jgi:hypothetical protein
MFKVGGFAQHSEPSIAKIGWKEVINLVGRGLDKSLNARCLWLFTSHMEKAIHFLLEQQKKVAKDPPKLQYRQ